MLYVPVNMCTRENERAVVRKHARPFIKPVNECDWPDDAVISITTCHITIDQRTQVIHCGSIFIH